MSQGTRRLTEGVVVFEDLGSLAGKGQAAPVRAHELKQELRGRTWLEVSGTGGLTPLVGRDREIEAIGAGPGYGARDDPAGEGDETAAEKPPAEWCLR